MISPQEQQLLQPRQDEKSRFTPFLSPLFLILVCIVIPLVLPFAMTQANEVQVAGIVLGILAVGVVIAQPYWGLILFIGLIYVRPEESIPALEGMHFTLLVSIVTLIGTLAQLAINRDKLVRDPLN